MVKSEYFSEERDELINAIVVANEILAIQIRNDKGQPILIIGVYRPD